MIEYVIRVCFFIVKRIIKIKDHQCANGMYNPWAMKYNNCVANFFEKYLIMKGISVQIIIPFNPENNGIYVDNERIFFPIDNDRINLKQLKFNYKIKDKQISQYLYLLQDITLWDRTDYR